MLSSPKSSKLPLSLGSKIHLKDFAISDEKENRNASKSASKKIDAMLEQFKSRTALADQLAKMKKAKSTTTLANPLK
jgi:hypothetical protein